MRGLYRLGVIALLLAGLQGPAHGAGAMRCGSRIVDEGKLAAEVLAACGEPDYRDAWGYAQPRTGQWIADVEEWYYNFGPSQLLRVLRLRNGRVVEIGADGYGYAGDPFRRCTPTDVVPGLSKFRLLRACGEPLTRRAMQVYAPLEQRVPRRDPWIERPRLRSGYYEHVFREEWVYNFGSRYLMRIVTIENGRVADVQNGDRGFDGGP